MAPHSVAVSTATLAALCEAHAVLGRAAAGDQLTAGILNRLAEVLAQLGPPPDGMEAEIAACACGIAALTFPYLSPLATPDELAAARDFLVRLYEAVDPLIEAAGRELAGVVRHGFDLAPFKDQLQGALAGNATYEIERIAEIERDEAAA